jgi:hypothetical protein
MVMVDVLLDQQLEAQNTLSGLCISSPGKPMLTLYHLMNAL